MIINPYIHFDEGRIYNPLRDEALDPSDRSFAALNELRAGRAHIREIPREVLTHLVDRQWLVERGADLSRDYYLKYVSIESHTICNQRCYFCPVSIAPRQRYFMPDDLYRSIVHQLAAHRETIEGVSMTQYNEPTLDPRFVDQVRLLKDHGLPPAIVSNGTGLTPDVVDAIHDMGGVRYVSINLSTLDEENYRRERGSRQLARVLANLRYMKKLTLAPEMVIAVLGNGDEEHRSTFEAIEREFRGSSFTVQSFEIMDRAGNVPVGRQPAKGQERLCGCEQTGSRPLQWLHITARGSCVLCCQDYHERYVVGDLNTETIDDVLHGARFARYRRWAYGVEPAPEDFICNACVYARRCAT